MITREMLIECLEQDLRHLKEGCHDGSCLINLNRGGMKTNARCTCYPRDFKRQFQAYVEHLEEYGYGGWSQ